MRYEDIMKLLHSENPYADFRYEERPYDPAGWGSQSEIFKKLIAEKRPSLVIEVGTWKGGSALHIASILTELGLDTPIICVDTWLGAFEFWNHQEDKERHLGLKLQHGYPMVYFDFLANVCHAAQDKRIIPFPQTASCGALWFRTRGIAADFIYLDASHEEEDVYEDIQNYWEVVTPSGILLGDDWTWDGVRLAVERFARERKLEIHLLNEKWHLYKI